MIRLTGLWNHKEGEEEFLSGSFGSGVLLVYKNNKKFKDTDPDYVVYLREKLPRKES